MSKMYHIIMCGGIGSRFWPMSTTKTPKQFLKLIGEKSLLRLTVDRLLKITASEEIIIVTSRKYKNLKDKDFFTETYGRKGKRYHIKYVKIPH